MKERVHLARWRSEKGERRFRAMEDDLWADLCERAPEAIDVETRLGPTRAYRWAGTGEPLVFLHGIGGTSLAWLRYVEALESRDVYAIDIIGDVGRSEQRVPFEDAADLAEWLDEVLAKLGIERAHLVGHSLGGFAALNLAVRRPRRIASLVLLDPVGIAKLSMLGFLLWGVPVLLGAVAPGPVRRWLSRRMRMPLLESKPAIRLALYGSLHHVPGFPALLPFDDAQLRSIAAPVTLLVGEKTEVFDATALVERARALIPHVAAELVPGAGHALTLSHFDHCLSRLPAVA